MKLILTRSCGLEVVVFVSMLTNEAMLLSEIILKLLFIPFNHNQIGYACMNETIIEHIKLTCWI